MATAAEVVTLLNLPAHLATREVYERLADEPRLSETFRKGIRRALNRHEHERQRFEASFGVRWSGMQDDPPELPPLAELEAAANAVDAFKSTPRGRFLAALAGVEKVDPAQGDRIRAHYNRMLADERQPLDVAAVGTALAMLNAIADQAARDAIDALARLLIDAQRRAA